MSERAAEVRGASAVDGADVPAASAGTAVADEIARNLDREGVRIVRVIHADLFGKARSKQFPVTELAEIAGGVGYCKASVVESIQGVPLEGGNYPADLGYPDIRALPDLRSARVLPWEPDTAWIVADLIEDGGSSELCSRGALRRACDSLAQVGLSAVTATEPEFYLMRETAEGIEPYSPGLGMAYTAGRRADPGGVLGRMHRSLIKFGISVTAANREFSPGQFEVNLRHGPALGAGDDSFLFKEAVKELALDEGLIATFMAMPFAEHAGSSCHLHVSLWDGDRNAFAGDDEDGLSDIYHAFIAGVLEHSPALTAFASPTVNSYKRTAAGGLVPDAARLGGDDREAYIRVPGERGKATRVELRAGDAAANPYLLIAGTLLTGLDGIRRGLRVGGEDDAPELPHTLDDAVDALVADQALCDGLGAELIRIYAALKRGEWERFANAVTDWEWNEYVHQA